MNLVELHRRTARRTPDHPAVVMGEQRLTYGQLLDEVAAVAGGLRALGVGKGDRVLLFGENSPQYLIAHLAAARLGAISATAAATFRSAELTFILGNAEPTCAVVDAGLRALLDGTPGADGLPVVEISGAGFAGLPAAAPVHDDQPVLYGDGVLISYTSGTTSAPKAVFHSHGSLLGLVRAYASIWHLEPADRVLVALPMAWLYGLVTAAQTALAAGATVVLEPRFNPVRALDAMEAEGVTVFIGVTTMYVKLLQVLEARGDAPLESRLRFCVTGGEPRSEEAFARFRARFGVPVHDVYAASECTPICTYDPHADPEPRPGSCGRLVPGVEIRIVDAEGADVPAGEVGELLARGPGLMLGYYRDPELTAVALAGGWYRSKDLFRCDADGYYHLVGRASDLIIRGGANISPLEVEAVLERHPAVAECAVAGRADAARGEEVCAFVVMAPGAAADADALRAHCAAELAAYKVPTTFSILDELPRGPTGKVVKSALVDDLAGSAAVS
jgi:long-chain acyl-CoA synthetase